MYSNYLNDLYVDWELEAAEAEYNAWMTEEMDYIEDEGDSEDEEIF